MKTDVSEEEKTPDPMTFLALFYRSREWMCMFPCLFLGAGLLCSFGDFTARLVGLGDGFDDTDSDGLMIEC